MVQRDADWVIAHSLQWTFRHADFRFADFEALSTQCFSDVAIGDGTEQTAINASLLCHLQHVPSQLFAASLGSVQQSCLLLLQFDATRFKLSLVGFCCTLGLALWNQEVAAIAVLDSDHI